MISASGVQLVRAANAIARDLFGAWENGNCDSITTAERALLKALGFNVAKIVKKYDLQSAEAF